MIIQKLTTLFDAVKVRELRVREHTTQNISSKIKSVLSCIIEIVNEFHNTYNPSNYKSNFINILLYRKTCPCKSTHQPFRPSVYICKKIVPTRGYMFQ